jgi:CxxC motif-containing protein (DUF1111 family)
MAIRIGKLLTLQAGVFVLLTANVWSQEAALGFDAQNGLLSPKQFQDARQAFEEIETPQKGLGIHFNEASCATCHVAPGPKFLPGGSGAITEIRAGFVGVNNEFFPAPGGTLITTKAVGNAIPEIKALSDKQNVRDRFITPSLFGAGFVEAVPDEDFRKIQRKQMNDSNGRIRGIVREVPILEAPGNLGVGRFGWVSQHTSLLSFSADAYRNEEGITSPLMPNDNTFLGDPVDDGVPDPEDKGGEFGEDVESFTRFMRALDAPPRVLPADKKERDEIEEGFKVFRSVGCSACHLPELTTADEGTLVNGKTFKVPKALGNKKFHPYGDYLLHDIGTGPNTLREGMTPEMRGKIRTAPLWGLGTRLAKGDLLLHDGSARTLEDAIQRHKNTAAKEAEDFQRLPLRDRTRLLKFLRSL